MSEDAEERTNVQDAGLSNENRETADGSLNEEAKQIIDGATMLTVPCKVHIHQERLNSMVTWVARCLQTIEKALIGQQELLGRHGKRLEIIEGGYLELHNPSSAPAAVAGEGRGGPAGLGPEADQQLSEAHANAAGHQGHAHGDFPSEGVASSGSSLPSADRCPGVADARNPQQSVESPSVGRCLGVADARNPQQSVESPSVDRWPGVADARNPQQSVENSLLPLGEQKLANSEALRLSSQQETFIGDLEGISEDVQPTHKNSEAAWPLASTSPAGSRQRSPFDDNFLDRSRCSSRLESRGSIASRGKLARKLLDHQETLRRVEDQVRGDVQTLSEVVQGLQHDLGLRIDELFDNLRGTAKQSIAKAAQLDSEHVSQVRQEELQREASENLCISGLPEKTGDRDLKNMFQELDCDVVDHRIIADPRGTRTSVAMVQLTSKEQGSRAMEALNGRLSPGADGSRLQVGPLSHQPSELPESEEALSELLTPKLASPQAASTFSLSPTGAQNVMLPPHGARTRSETDTTQWRARADTDTTQRPIDPNQSPAGMAPDSDPSHSLADMAPDAKMPGPSFMTFALDESDFVSKPNLESALNDMRGDMADQLTRLRERFESVQQNIEAKIQHSRSHRSVIQAPSSKGDNLAAFVFSPPPGFNCAACGQSVDPEQMRWTSPGAKTAHSLFPARSPRTTPKKKPGAGKSAESRLYDKLQQQIALEHARRTQYLPAISSSFMKTSPRQSPKSMSGKSEKSPKRDSLRKARSLPALNRVPGVVNIGLDLQSERLGIFKSNARVWSPRMAGRKPSLENAALVR